MTRVALALAAALLVSAAPAFAHEPPCRDCPMHKAQAASADKDAKKDPAACPCGAASPKECKCGPGKCACSAKKDESKKGATKS